MQLTRRDFLEKQGWGILKTGWNPLQASDKGKSMSPTEPKELRPWALFFSMLSEILILPAAQTVV